MKKSFLLVLFALLSTVSFAQVSFGVKGGVAMSSFYGDNSDNTKVKFAGRVGLGFEYAVNDMFSIQPTLYFSDKGTKYDADGLSTNAEYLELPIDAQFRFNLDKGMNFIAAAGPYFAYGIGGKKKYESGSVTVKSDTFDSLKDWDMGLNFEAGLEFNQFLVGIYTELGLLNVSKGGPKNYTVGLNFGYRF